mgnify:FL=1
MSLPLPERHRRARDERRPLLWPTAPERSWLSESWPLMQLLALPLLLGTVQSVTIAAEVDALRSISCAHYYYINPPLRPLDGIDADLCLRPSVESHFNSIATRVTISVVLANFASMVVNGRLFTHRARRFMALIGMLGNVVARLPFLVLPIMQYPFLAPPALQAWSPPTVLVAYWTCALLCGLSGATELVMLVIESLIVDLQSPAKRSHLFRNVQVAILLGASAGPLLGGAAMTALPSLTNRCLGYTHCLANEWHASPLGPRRILFGTASYWLAVVFSTVGLLWVVAALPSATPRNAGQNSCTTCESRDAERTSGLAEKPSRFAWMGAFQRLVPVRFGESKLPDARILLCTLSEVFFALTREGNVVLILVLGYVFHWNSSKLSLGLSVWNSLQLLTIAVLMPRCLDAVSRTMSRPASIAGLSDEQIYLCTTMNDMELYRQPRCCSEAVQRRDIQLVDSISIEQRKDVRLWRAQVDLTMSRISFTINVVSWLTIAIGVSFAWESLVLLGALLLTAGCAAQPLLHAAACTIADAVVSAQKHPVLPGTQAKQSKLPGGADSYLVIVSTLLLPCLLLGLILRNIVYGATVTTFPGAFLFVVSAFEMLALVLLLTLGCHKPTA